MKTVVEFLIALAIAGILAIVLWCWWNIQILRAFL